MGRFGMVRVPGVLVLFECRRGVRLERGGEGGVEAAPCGGILFVEIFDNVRCVIEVGGGFPGVFSMAIAFPFDQILKFLVEDAGVKDFFDLVLLFAVNDVRWWGCRLFEAIIAPGAESINMYDRVDIQAGGQFNSII